MANVVGDDVDRLWVVTVLWSMPVVDGHRVAGTSVLARGPNEVAVREEVVSSMKRVGHIPPGANPSTAASRILMWVRDANGNVRPAVGILGNDEDLRGAGPGQTVDFGIRFMKEDAQHTGIGGETTT